jgi:cyanophycin synthetase
MPQDSKPGVLCATSADCASSAKWKTEHRVAGVEDLAAAPPEPNHGFDNSRRLTGTNRYFADPAVTLTPLGSSARNSTALQSWATRVRAMCEALGWPDPQPRIETRAAGTLLVFKAPPDSLLSATELSEWAWERAAAEQGEAAFDLAHDFDDSRAAAEFAARSAAEAVAALQALRAAAARHRVPLFEDDAEVSLGAGSGSRRWPREKLPAEDAVPWSELHDVPTALVTGSNGKTTTVRLLAAMAADTGLTPGYCCTEGVFVDAKELLRGDYSGPDGARVVLRHAAVQAAILETARGGILRRGLAVRRADVAIVTNISADHLGEYGVEDANDLAETKLVVARAVQNGGLLVLNADDAILMAAAERLPHAAAARLALFARDHAHPALRALRAGGGSTCAVSNGDLLLCEAGREVIIGKAETLPLTVGGAAAYNVANLAAAALAGLGLGFAPESVMAVLRRFGSAPLDNPGRLERWHYRGALVLIDFAHNPDALDQLLRVARALHPPHLFLLLGQAGNREDDAIADLARTAARFSPDCVMIKELPHMLRGRMPGEVPALLMRALLAAGVPAERILEEPDEETAARRLLDAAQPGDVVVLPVHTRAVRERIRASLEA